MDLTDPPSSIDSGRFRARLHDETTALLVARIRSGLWLLLVAIALFGAEALRTHETQFLLLLLVKAVQLLTVVVVALLVRWPPPWRRAVWIALGTVIEVSTTTALSGLLRNEATSSFMVLSVLVMGTATLLPWGLWPQAVAVTAAGAAALANATWITGAMADSGPPLVGVAIASVTSLYVAHAFERYRIERRLAEEQARAAAARNAAILEAALDCIVSMDHEGRITEFNPAAERTFGQDRAAVLGRPLADVLLPPALRQAHRDGLARYLATGDGPVLGRRIETTGRRADGGEFPIELAVTRIPGVDPPLFTGYLRDLTDRRLAQEARVSATLVRAGHEMMMLLDTPLILERLCALTTEVLQCDCSHAYLGDTRTERWKLVAAHGDPPDVEGALRALSANGVEVAALLARLRREDAPQVLTTSQSAGFLADDEHHAVASSLYVPLHRNDQFVGFLTAAYHERREPFTADQQSIARGLAQIASMALTNARLVEALAQASRIKSEFLSTMSHELRTPLNAILGYAEMLGDDAIDAGEHTALAGRIGIKGRELLTLVEGTLEIGKIEAGRSGVRNEPIRLSNFWATLAATCADLPRDAGVELVWEPVDGATTLQSDPHKLGTVMRHLVGNALKFTPRGTVRVSARVGDEVAFRVADTGIGIAAEHQQIVFEMFRQADGSESRSYGGAGLGLYIVRRFVEELGGTVELESAPGRGSVFTVRLPRSPAARRGDGAASAARASG